MKRRAIVRLFLTGLVVTLGCAGAGLAYLQGWQLPSLHGSEVTPAAAETTPRELVVAVKTIRPKRNPAFQVSVQQIATVEPYYEAELRARVAGVVKRVHRDIGEPVRKGELLVEIDVPDLEQGVLQKEGVVEQRRREWQLAKAQARNAAAALEVAKASIEQQKVEVMQAEANRDYRGQLLQRFRVMAKGQVVNGNLVDERQRDYDAAVAAVAAARAGVQKAQAAYQEKVSMLQAAQADVGLKESLIEVARKDLDLARALADYSRIPAPFDGVVVRRNADPGMFVQNATTAHTEPLLTVARVDVVTVSMRLPDNAAAFVSPDSDVTLRMNELPGVTIRGKVSRYSPSVENSDRTMRVEVDLLNGGESDYHRWQAQTVAAGLAPLGLVEAAPLLTAAGVGQTVASHDLKGSADRLPLPACTRGSRPLLPGMTGYMRIDLRKFTDVYLLPSSAVFTKGGMPYILVVRDGLTRLEPVDVQVNDGKVVKLVLLGANKRNGAAEVPRELTGTEAVVASRQLEIGEGQKVQAAPSDW